MAQKQKVVKNPRELAVACMCEVEKEGLLVPEAMVRIPYRLSDEDRNFAYKIVYDSFRHLPGLTRVLAAYCKPRKLPAYVRWLLITSICQLIYTRSPDYAVVDEANKLAMPRFRGLKPLVNGVLRNILREKKPQWDQWDERTWLLPDWMSNLFKEQHGAERLNTWLKTWGEVGSISYWSASNEPLEGDDPSEALPHAFRRTSPIPTDMLESRNLYVQNETSQAVGELVCRSGAQRVLDLCAAPGGKACYVAAFGKPQLLVACDSSPERMARLVDNRDRLGLDFETRCRAAHETDDDDRLYDFVLADAPCSGIGIIGRHPEIKFLKKSGADEGLRQLQTEILEAGWRSVKPGGHLLYTVCSLDKSELPQPPEGALLAGDQAVAWLPEGVPYERDGDIFSFSPTSVFDGFLGMLLTRPKD